MKKIAFLIVAVAIGFAACEKDDSVFSLDGIDNVSTADAKSSPNAGVTEGKADSNDGQNNKILNDDETYDNNISARDQQAF